MNLVSSHQRLRKNYYFTVERREYTAPELTGRYIGSGETPSATARMQAGHFPYTERAYQPQRHLQTIWDGLHSSLRNLFQKSFRRQAGSSRITRPSALEWMNALDHAKKRLNECRRNPQHKYFDNSRGCIWCQLAASGGNAFPALPANARQPARTTASRNPVPAFDQVLDCRDCGKQFRCTAGEQQSYQSRGVVPAAARQGEIPDKLRLIP